MILSATAEQNTRIGFPAQVHPVWVFSFTDRHRSGVYLALAKSMVIAEHCGRVGRFIDVTQFEVSRHRYQPWGSRPRLRPSAGGAGAVEILARIGGREGFPMGFGQFCGDIK